MTTIKPQDLGTITAKIVDSIGVDGHGVAIIDHTTEPGAVRMGRCMTQKLNTPTETIVDEVRLLIDFFQPGNEHAKISILHSHENGVHQADLFALAFPAQIEPGSADAEVVEKLKEVTESSAIPMSVIFYDTASGELISPRYTLDGWEIRPAEAPHADIPTLVKELAATFQATYDQLVADLANVKLDRQINGSDQYLRALTLTIHVRGADLKPTRPMVFVQQIIHEGEVVDTPALVYSAGGRLVSVMLDEDSLPLLVMSAVRSAILLDDKQMAKEVFRGLRSFLNDPGVVETLATDTEKEDAPAGN